MTHIVHVVNEKALEDLNDVLLSEDVSSIRYYNPGDNHENLMIKFTDPSTGELLIALTEDLEKQIKTCGKKPLAVMDIRDFEKKVSELLA